MNTRTRLNEFVDGNTAVLFGLLAVDIVVILLAGRAFSLLLS